MKPILEVRNISKEYTIDASRKRYLSLGGSLVAGLQGFLKKPKKEQFWALEDVNFDVYPGDSIGIIGQNGAGKSTLLKIISKITPPTKGYIKARGRIASLLEVGTGFHPELTGRENIFLNGSILGLKRKEIISRFDEIIDFSGVERFLDTPLKHYSSGMQLRLAFSVAAHLDPEILIIDEVLAVGDAAFQKKCLRKMEDVSKNNGRTVLFVSHNMGAVASLCEKGIVLKNGQAQFIGEISKAIDTYFKSTKETTTIESIIFKGSLSKKMELKDVMINNLNPFEKPIGVSQLKDLEFRILFQSKIEYPFRVTMSIFKKEVRIFSLHDSKFKKEPICEITSVFIIPGKILRPGIYTLAIGGHQDHEKGEWFWCEDVCIFEIIEEWDRDIEPINLGIINILATTNRIVS
jgi:lipopolysaccharide transport system ATP-binding protein